MTLDHRQLEVFVAIAEHGSMGRASQSLAMSQPLISRLLRRLELKLGVDLFRRHATGMDATDYGLVFLPWARAVLSDSANGIEAIRALSGQSSKIVKIGAIGSIAAAIMPGVVSGLTQVAPGLQINFLEAVEDQLARAMISGEIDIAICGLIEETDEIERVDAIEFEDEYRVIASYSRAQEIGQLSAAAASRLDWALMPSVARPRQDLVRCFRALGLEPPRAVMETRSIAAMLAVVSAGNLLGWIPEPLIRPALAAGHIGVISSPELEVRRHFHVYRRRRGFPTEPVFETLRLLRSMALLPKLK